MTREGIKDPDTVAELATVCERVLVVTSVR